MQLFNLHTHTLYSDGKAEAEEFVQEAIKQNFDVLGFSEHSPLPFETPFSISEKQMDEYVQKIEILNKKYGNHISLFKALEFDFIPGLTKDFQKVVEKYHLDYAIGAVHLVKPDVENQIWFIDGPDINIYDDGIKAFFNGDIRKAVKKYFYQIHQMIESQNFDIIAHLDKIKMHNQNRYFTEDEKWYRLLIDETLELIKRKDIIVEVNTRGIYKKRCDSLFPGIEALKKIHQLGISVTISSDTHKPEEISSYFPEAIKILRELNFQNVVLYKNGWIERSL